jgi:LysM repeat protein
VSGPAAPTSDADRDHTVEVSETTVTVEPGDTLWDIAEQHLNDPTRHPEIFAENRDVTQPDGRTLTDPDLIHPGWQLVIPGDTDDDTGDEAAADGDASDPDDGQERDGRRDQPEADENVKEGDPADDGGSRPDAPANEGKKENGYPEDDEVVSGWLGLSDSEEPADAAGTGVENIQSSVQASGDSDLMRVVATTTGVGAARGLPTDDPCEVIDEVTLSRMDGEVSSWHTSTYTNGCSWRVTLDGLEDEVSLHYRRSVPMSGEDADFREEQDDEFEASRDVDALYEKAVQNAAELSYALSGTSVTGSEERPLSFGEESVIVVTDISYGGSGSDSQDVYLIVREGEVVSQLSFLLSVRDDRAIDLDEAEDLLSEVTTDVFG